MSHKFFLGLQNLLLLAMLALLALTACASPAGVATTQPSSSDQVATIVAATMQAIPSNTPEPPPTVVTQALTFEASDASSDCFNGISVLDTCAGLDLLGVRVGLQELVLDTPNDDKLPVVFVVAFTDLPEGAEEFTIYLYLDLDQNPSTGLDMSAGASRLPGIDRLIGVNLPSGEPWMQVVAKGGYEAEIIKDERISARVVGNRVVVVVGRAILDERALVGAGEQIPPAVGLVVPVGHALGVNAGGGAPDDFTLYIGTARSSDALDYFNGDQDIHVPLAMTVPMKVMYPPNAGGGS